MTGAYGRRDGGSLERVGAVLDGLLARIGGGEASRLMRVREVWPQIAGERWRSLTRPVKVIEDRLVVEVPDGATASLARYATTELAARVRAAVPEVGISTITVRVAPGPRGPMGPTDAGSSRPEM